MPEIQRLSIRHEAIMDFLMVNPTMKLQDVAQHFGVTQPWLSCIIHSDIFQAKLREKSDIAFHYTVLPLRDKMMNVAHMALDKLAEVLPKETETKIVAGVAEGVLDRLGFGTKAQQAPGSPVNVQVNVLRSELEDARALLGKAPRPMLEVTIDGERSGIALPLRSETEVGASNPGNESPIQAFCADGQFGAKGN